jgi:hypothetical protein
MGGVDVGRKNVYSLYRGRPQIPHPFRAKGRSSLSGLPTHPGADRPIPHPRAAQEVWYPVRKEDVQSKFDLLPENLAFILIIEEHPE